MITSYLPRLFILCLLFLPMFACKKQIEKAKTDALLQAMTANDWYVAQYTDGANVWTADFDGYVFKFRSDYTVTATLGTASTTGTWAADINTKLLSANYPAGNPLERLNGSWSIYYQDSQGPKMNQFVNGVERKLVLRIK